MSESGHAQRRIAIALAIAAFVISAIALVVAISRRGGGDDAPAAPARTPKVNGSGSAQVEADASAFIHKLDDKHVVVARSFADDLFANPAKALAWARVVPAPNNGGFKLFAIQPGSAPDLLGFKNGDLIRGVNGMDLGTPAAALNVYQDLKVSTHVTIDLDRRGEAMQLSIEIR